MRRADLSAAALLCMATLSGCAVGPDYKRPDVRPPEAYRGEAAGPSARSVADVPWWELYKDPALAELIRTALAQNLDLQLAAARVEEARALAGVAQAEFFPTVTGTLGTSPTPRSKTPVPGPGGTLAWMNTGPGATYTGGAQLSWEIDFFGRVRRANQAARADLFASEAGRSAAVSSLVAQVAETYFTLVVLDEERAITLRTIESNQASLDLVRAQMRGGIASSTEEQQALGQLASVRADLPVIERRIALAENQLSVLLGQPPGPILRGRGEESPIPPDVPAGLPSELLERRPDVRQAEEALVAATARIGVAKAEAFPFPRFFLTAFAGAVSTTLSGLLQGGGASLSAAGPTVNWPLLDLGGQANVRAAEARAVQAALTYRSTILTALREVADALVTLQTVRGQLEQDEIRVTSGREYTRLTRLRYRGGVSDYLEVLDAERQTYTAEIQQQDARLAQLSGVVQLYKALGGGWVEAPPEGTKQGTAPYERPS
jgi:outer membrane protein, multidrug efflux system